MHTQLRTIWTESKGKAASKVSAATDELPIPVRLQLQCLSSHGQGYGTPNGFCVCQYGQYHSVKMGLLFILSQSWSEGGHLECTKIGPTRVRYIVPGLSYQTSRGGYC